MATAACVLEALTFSVLAPMSKSAAIATVVVPDQPKDFMTVSSHSLDQTPKTSRGR